MSKHWFKVFFAAFFEVGWVIGLNHANSVLTWGGTIIAIIVSFYFLITAGRTLPVGTVYAVFVGLGTAGTVVSDILFFGQPFEVGKILFILLLLVGVIGLKLVTPNETEERSEA